MEKVEGRGSNAKKRVAGRPKKAVKRDRFLIVRLNPAEYLMITGRAEKASMKPSGWLRRAAREATIIPRFTAEEMGLLKAFAGVANNLNQLTKLAHAQGLLRLVTALRDLMGQAARLMEKLSRDDR